MIRRKVIATRWGRPRRWRGCRVVGFDAAVHRQHPGSGQPVVGGLARHRSADRGEGRCSPQTEHGLQSRLVLNAIVALAVVGGSTNAVVHLLAIAGTAEHPAVAGGLRFGGIGCAVAGGPAGAAYRPHRIAARRHPPPDGTPGLESRPPDATAGSQPYPRTSLHDLNQSKQTDARPSNPGNHLITDSGLTLSALTVVAGRNLSSAPLRAPTLCSRRCKLVSWLAAHQRS